MQEGEQKRDIVIYLGSGAMAGIFGVGVMQAVAASPVRQRVTAVYGVSAGAMTGLYYLSGQLDELVRLYLEDMRDDRFVRWHLFRRYFWRVLGNGLFGTSFVLEPLFNNQAIDYAVTNTRRVNFATFNQSGIPLWLTSYCLDTGQHEYLQINEEDDLVPVLRATTGGQPGHHEAAIVQGQSYIDGATITDRHFLEKLQARHPNQKVVLVLSSTANRVGRLRAIGVAAGVAMLMWGLFGARHGWRTFWQEFQPDVFAPAKSSGVTVVESEYALHRFTTDPLALQKLLEHGRAKGEAWLVSLEA